MLFRSPLTGRLLRYCGHINGGSSGAVAAGGVVVEALERLSAGVPVLIFPEGTRSPERSLRPFKRGAFEIACRASVPVAPLLIRCEPAVLAKEAPWYRAPKTPSCYTITALPALHPHAWNGNARAMAADVQRMFQDCLGVRTSIPSRSVAELPRAVAHRRGASPRGGAAG